MSTSKDPIDPRRRIRSLGLRRGSVERRAPIQMIDFDENRAGFRRAATATAITATIETTAAAGQ